MEPIHKQHFFRRCWNISIHPTDFFDQLKKEKVQGIAAPFWHVFLVHIFSNGLLLFLLGVLISIVIAVLPIPYEDTPISIGIVWLIILGAYIVFLIGGIISLFIGAGIYHLFVKLFKGQKGFAETFAVVAYASSPMLLSFTVFFNSLLAIYTVILTIIGVAKMHNISTGKAVAAILIPTGIFMVLLIGAYIVFLLVAMMGELAATTASAGLP